MLIQDMEIKHMVKLAKEAMDRSYSPYSSFKVGACLRGASGAYYLGCNIENVAYSPSLCAERVAIAKAVYEGERGFDAIAIVSQTENVTVPCGVCRQVLAEFCDGDTLVICANKDGKYNALALSELLPYPFLPEDIK